MTCLNKGAVDVFQKRVVSNVWAAHKDDKLSLESEFAAAIASADTVIMAFVDEMDFFKS